MIKAILNEVKHIAVKKRFIILSALLFLWMIVWAVLAKTDYFNDHIYTVKMQRFLRIFFNPAVGCILLFAQYRRRFTKTLVEEAKERIAPEIELRLQIGLDPGGGKLWDRASIHVPHPVFPAGVALLRLFCRCGPHHSFQCGCPRISAYQVPRPIPDLVLYGSRVYGRNPGADQMGLSSDPPYLYGDILRPLDPFLLSEEKADHEKIEAGGRYGLCRVSGKSGIDRRDGK